jgi:hypothetical protein
MKPAESRLIKTFLLNVKEGNVTGLERSSGPTILDKITKALQAILDGEEPETALDIERKAGQPSEDRNFIVAYIIRDQRKKGEKAAVAHLEANNWLIKEGYRDKKLSDKRLRVIYNQHKAQLVQRETIELMLQKTEQHSKKRE